MLALPRRRCSAGGDNSRWYYGVAGGMESGRLHGPIFVFAFSFTHCQILNCAPTLREACVSVEHVGEVVEAEVGVVAPRGHAQEERVACPGAGRRQWTRPVAAAGRRGRVEDFHLKFSVEQKYSGDMSCQLICHGKLTETCTPFSCSMFCTLRTASAPETRPDSGKR